MHSKKKNQVSKENDPDTLQMNDELNETWVNAWKKALDNTNPPGLSLLVHTEKTAAKIRQKK